MKRVKEKEYKVDSTKGMSLINPINYKGDVLVQVWVDSRVLATLCRWIDSNEGYVRFMSQVVRRPLEVLAEMLVKNGQVEIVESTVEARKMLERRFGVNLNPGKRGTKNVLHNMTLSERGEELSEELRNSKGLRQRSVEKKVDPRVEEALRIYKELFGNEESKE
jgi:hypothetical protein